MPYARLRGHHGAKESGRAAPTPVLLGVAEVMFLASNRLIGFQTLPLKPKQKAYPLKCPFGSTRKHADLPGQRHKHIATNYIPTIWTWITDSYAGSLVDLCQRWRADLDRPVLLPDGGNCRKASMSRPNGQPFGNEQAAEYTNMVYNFIKQKEGREHGAIQGLFFLGWKWLVFKAEKF
jgi:hypothetical protein